MATTRGNQGNNQGGSRGRGFASMDDDQQRQIARKGGQASARAQSRDAQGQFAGSRGTGGAGSSGGSRASGNSGSSGSSRGSNRGGNQGGSNRGGNQGGSSR